MKLGEINTLKVLRETDIAYLLTDGEEEVFLHKKEAKKPYEDNEELDVFLYSDNQGRVTASTKEPLITLEQVRQLEVVEVGENYGVFLYYGMVKDLLLSLDDLPGIKKFWPQVGDKVFVKLINKGEKLLGKIVGRKQITPEFEELEVLEDHSVVDCNVMYVIDHGIVAFTEQGHEIFIHQNNYRKTYRIGEPISPKILKQNPSGEYVGTLIEQKEIMLEKDAQIIMEYLDANNGEMSLTDKSSPELISKTFHMSKSAFKRALGSLYRARLVELKKNKTKKL